MKERVGQSAVPTGTRPPAQGGETATHGPGSGATAWPHRRVCTRPLAAQTSAAAECVGAPLRRALGPQELTAVGVRARACSFNLPSLRRQAPWLLFSGKPWTGDRKAQTMRDSVELRTASKCAPGKPGP